jgi:hypothetical protein
MGQFINDSSENVSDVESESFQANAPTMRLLQISRVILSSQPAISRVDGAAQLADAAYARGTDARLTEEPASLPKAASSFLAPRQH